MSATDKKPDRELIVTPEFRVSFPNVFAAKAYLQGQPKFSLVMLFPKATDLSKLKEAARKVRAEKYGNNPPADLNIPFKDGDEPNTRGVVYEGYAGCITCAASNTYKPDVVFPNKEFIVSPADFYAGCYAIASVIAFTYDKGGNRGIAFSLQNIQKTRDGEPFSGRTRAADDFDVIPQDVSQAEQTNPADPLGL